VGLQSVGVPRGWQFICHGEGLMWVSLSFGGGVHHFPFISMYKSINPIFAYLECAFVVYLLSVYIIII